METLKQVLTWRDDMTAAQADKAISEAKKRVWEGEDPEDVLLDEFGLEPDYFFDLCD